jgi:hypothetical protein
MAVRQFAELLDTEASGRCSGHPALGQGAPAGGAAAAFQDPRSPTTVPARPA